MFCVHEAVDIVPAWGSRESLLTCLTRLTSLTRLTCLTCASPLPPRLCVKQVVQTAQDVFVPSLCDLSSHIVRQGCGGKAPSKCRLRHRIRAKVAQVARGDVALKPMCVALKLKRSADVRMSHVTHESCHT